MKKYDIKYIGNLEAIDLNKTPYLIKNIEALFSSEIQINETNYQLDNRSEVNSFYFNSIQKDLEIQVYSKNKEELINHLDYVFSNDRSLKKAGRLYVDDWYVNCYFIKSSPNYFRKFGIFETVTYTVLILSNWIKEDKFDFDKNDDVSSTIGLKYPFSYPFSYSALKKERYVNNSHFAPAKAKIIFYGPVKNPKIEIGGYVYSVSTELLENERIEINPFDKTVVKITEDGTAIDEMDNRYVKTSVFTEIQTGLNLFQQNDKFSCSVTMYYERGLPEWK